MHKFVILLSLGLLLTLASCQHEPDFSSLKAVSYTNDIEPIIAGNCAMSGCHIHRGGGSNGSSGNDDDDDLFPLTTYEEVMENGEISPGNSHNSKLYEVITNKGEDPMPPPPRPLLSDDQIRLIYVWIEQGAVDN